MTPPPLESDGHELYLQPDHSPIFVLPLDDWLTLLETFSRRYRGSPGIWFTCATTEEGYGATIEIHTKDPGTGECYHLPVDPDGVFWVVHAARTITDHVYARTDKVVNATKEQLKSLCSSKPLP